MVLIPGRASCPQVSPLLFPKDVQKCNSDFPSVLSYPVICLLALQLLGEYSPHDSPSMSAQEADSIVLMAHLEVLSQISTAEIAEHRFPRIWASEWIRYPSSSTALCMPRAPQTCHK